MGYVHDTQMRQFVSPKEMLFEGGTWNEIASGSVPEMHRAQEADAGNLIIPIDLLQNADGKKGSNLLSIDLWYRITTADYVQFTPGLYKETLPANGVSYPAAEEVSVTFDADHDTEAERIATGTHRMTITLDTPEWMDEDDFFYVMIEFEGAATSNLFMGPVRANYTLRV